MPTCRVPAADAALRATHEDHTVRYHAAAGHVAVALEAALGA